MDGSGDEMTRQLRGENQILRRKVEELQAALDVLQGMDGGDTTMTTAAGR